MPSLKKPSDAIKTPPFETKELRKKLSEFLNTEFLDPHTREMVKVGNFKWGVYAFFDYDGEPIYVGQTNESLRSRIGRHLTNQRTDAVAMSVLDPFEVYEIEVWPIPQFQNISGKDEAAKARFREAKAHLNALENLIYQTALTNSRFNAVLNEKDPPLANVEVTPPASLRGCIVSREVFELRSHLDIRIARRALIISRLAQVISERKVQGGLRRVLFTQATRLQSLSDRRYSALGGAQSVQRENGDETENDD